LRRATKVTGLFDLIEAVLGGKNVRIEKLLSPERWSGCARNRVESWRSTSK
jgi:hypothetical protein